MKTRYDYHFSSRNEFDEFLTYCIPIAASHDFTVYQISKNVIAKVVNDDIEIDFDKLLQFKDIENECHIFNKGKIIVDSKPIAVTSTFIKGQELSRCTSYDFSKDGCFANMESITMADIPFNELLLAAKKLEISVKKLIRNHQVTLNDIELENLIWGNDMTIYNIDCNEFEYQNLDYARAYLNAIRRYTECFAKSLFNPDIINLLEKFKSLREYLFIKEGEYITTELKENTFITPLKLMGITMNEVYKHCGYKYKVETLSKAHSLIYKL